MTQISLIDFDVEPFLRAAEILMKADEAERALALLKNLPGFYRDNEPPEIENLRKQIEAAIFQARDYMHLDDDIPKEDPQPAQWVQATMRGKVMLEYLSKLSGSQIPHIVDMGPGDYMLPLGLRYHGLAFTYEPIGLEGRALELASPRLKNEMNAIRSSDTDIWFVAYEIIEHLWQPGELAQTMARYSNVKKVFLSTPRYTFHRGHTTWRKDKQPHLRTYTPSEFRFVAEDLFKGYTWTYYDDPVMVLVGEKI